MSSLVRVLAVLLILGGVAYGAYIARPSSPLDGWNTYTNTEYGFSFKYPPTVVLSKPSTGGSPSGLERDSYWIISISNGKETSDKFSVNVWEHRPFSYNPPYFIGWEELSADQVSEVMVDGVRGFRYAEPATGFNSLGYNQDVIYTFPNKEGASIDFVFQRDRDDIKLIEPIQSQILSSIHIAKSTKNP